MPTHRYILEPYKTPLSRYRCPSCNHSRKTFKRYMDTQTQTHLAPHVGRCDREESCGYHYTPKQYFAHNPGQTRPAFRPMPPRPAPPHSTIPAALVAKSCSHYQQNNFYSFLGDIFDHELRQQLVKHYQVGTSSHWPGATVFWQIDHNNQARTGKIMLYNAHDGHRVKHPYNHITWAHTLLRNATNPNTAALGTPHAAFVLKQCLFGQHLLPQYPDKIVALVESEKTAIIPAGFMPQYLWLATGSLDGLNHQKCRVLRGRNVMLYPDVDGFKKWHDKMLALTCRMPHTNFNLSCYLQQNVPHHQRTPGMDIADYLVQDQLAQWQLERQWGLRA